MGRGCLVCWKNSHIFGHCVPILQGSRRAHFFHDVMRKSVEDGVKKCMGF